MKGEIFISYSWGDSKEKGESREAIVDALYEKLKGLGLPIVRDKKDVKYKDNIRQFEDRLGAGHYIILVISDKFLKSRHCMYEVLKITEHKDVYRRIFPIVLEDAAIFDDVTVLDYIDFWSKEIQRLQNRIKKAVDIVHTTRVHEQLKIFGEIRRLFDDFVQILQEMNTLSPSLHRDEAFSSLEAALRQQMQQDDSAGAESQPSSGKPEKDPPPSISEAGIAAQMLTINAENVALRDLNINKPIIFNGDAS